MEPSRGIKVTIDTETVKQNMTHLRNRYPGYDYYMAVVKANAYGHGLDSRLIAKIIEGGADYLVVCYMDDALRLRESFPDFPLLVLSPIAPEDIPAAAQLNITVTADSPAAARAIADADVCMKVHLKVDTGLHRFGMDNAADIGEAFRILDHSKAEIEGIYTHLISEEDVALMDQQITQFFDLTAALPMERIPIVHIPSGEALTVLPKVDYPRINGTRMGSVIYGMIAPEIGVKSAYRATAKVVGKRYVKRGESIGYQGCYTASEDEILAMLPIGYEMGFLRGWKSHAVYAGDTLCPIVGSVFMCQTYIRIPDHVQVGDSVEVFRDFEHVCSLSNAVHTIPEEILLALKPTVFEYI